MKLAAATFGALLIGGCVRMGYAPVAKEAGADGAPQVDGMMDGGRPDVSVDAATTAGLDEPCNPPSCAPELVCTGAQSTWFCRPPCADGCPQDEICGRPQIDGEIESTAPMACLSTKIAGRLEDCRTIICEAGLRCLRGEVDRCLGQCVSDSNCLPNETCVKNICFPVCVAEDEECPDGMYCTGFGDLPKNKCVPDPPLPLGASCLTGPCEPTARCVGWSSEPTTPHHCQLLCDDETDCLPGAVCASANAAKFCFQQCSLFDDPVKCEAWEVCLAVTSLQQVLCVPAEGDPDTCDDSTPCVSGKLCVDGICRLACDDDHPCQTGICMPLNNNGTPMPWKACTP